MLVVIVVVKSSLLIFSRFVAIDSVVKAKKCSKYQFCLSQINNSTDCVYKEWNVVECYCINGVICWLIEVIE